ncbi:MAG TPA: hypothetical protein VMM12_05900 [Longimicrobiales bacterium]|nr:hypothetical protein [Longimicrobiales bacterium]
MVELSKRLPCPVCGRQCRQLMANDADTPAGAEDFVCSEGDGGCGSGWRQLGKARRILWDARPRPLETRRPGKR